MPKSPAFQFYPDDYLSDYNVELMTLEEQGAYMRLLCHAWKNSSAIGVLSNDDKILARLSRLGDEKWQKSKENILRAFEVSDKTIKQKRLIKEHEKQKLFRNQKSKAGKEGAAKRWQKHGTGDGTGDGTGGGTPIAGNMAKDSFAVCNLQSADIKDTKVSATPDSSKKEDQKTEGNDLSRFSKKVGSDSNFRKCIELCEQIAAKRKDKWTFEFMGKRAAEDYRHFDVIAEYLQMILNNYCTEPASILYPLWNSKKMKGNYTEAVSIKNNALLKELEQKQAAQDRERRQVNV